MTPDVLPSAIPACPAPDSGTPPAVKTSLRIVRRRELIDVRWTPDWDDPDGIASMPAAKRAALLANPFCNDDDAPVQIIGLLDRRVIGRMDVIAGELESDGQIIPILWTSYLIVPPEYRGTLMGLMIILKFQAMHHTVAACAVSKLVHPIYEKLKWIDFKMPRYLLMRRSRPVIERYVGNRLLSHVATALVDGGLLAHRAVLRGLASLATRGLRFTAESRMSSDIDARLQSHHEPVAVRRTAAFVNWLLNSNFETDARNRRGLFYVRNRQGEVLAYFLATARFHPSATHREFKNLLLGSLKDWFIFDAAHIDLRQIILLSLQVFSEWDVDAVEVCLPDPSEVNLCHLGFLQVGELNLLVKIAPASPLNRPELLNSAAWWFRPGEGDNAFG